MSHVMMGAVFYLAAATVLPTTAVAPPRDARLAVADTRPTTDAPIGICWMENDGTIVVE